MPFLHDVRQPARGLAGLAISGAIGVALYEIFVALWKPWGATSWLVSAQYFIWVFNWIFWLLFHFGSWPLERLPQPWRGLAGFLVACALAWPTQHLVHALGWDAQQFNLGVAIMFWIFLLGPWGGAPIGAALKGRQPLAGANGFIASAGLGFLTFFFLPEKQILGHELGFPFVWFVAAVWVTVTFEELPIHALGQPLRALVLVGYLTFFSFILTGVLYAFGLDLFALDARAGTFLLIYLLALLVPPGLFNNWPLHRLHAASRGAVTAVFSTLVAVAVFRAVEAVAPAPGPPLFPHTPFAFITLRFAFMVKALVMGQCLFIGWWAYYGLMGMALAPKPEGSATLAARPDRSSADVQAL